MEVEIQKLKIEKPYLEVRLVDRIFKKYFIIKIPNIIILMLDGIGRLKMLSVFNPLNPELNPICYLLALLGAHHFLHVSRIRVKLLTFRRLMSYICVEHPFLMFLDHTRRSTVGRTPLDE